MIRKHSIFIYLAIILLAFFSAGFADIKAVTGRHVTIGTVSIFGHGGGIQRIISSADDNGPSFQVKTKKKVKVRYRARYCHFMLVKEPIFTYQFIVEDQIKTAHYDSSFYDPAEYLFKLRGPPVV